MAAPVRILYIDDDAGLGILLNRALSPHGYRVEAVPGGDEAMARLDAEDFDVVAMDHNLTNEVGLDIIPRIRALPHAPPIIYVTGSEDVRVAVAALKAGAVDYVWKDVQGHYRELLRQAVDAAIAQEALKRASEEAQREIAEARDRAEMLLKEVNHRVANSLAMVAGLLQMQAHATRDETTKGMMRDTQARITAIAGLHKRLYTSSDVRRVEIDAYLGSLVDELAAGLTLEGQHLKFVPSDEEIFLPTDRAVWLGVIIAELLTNASKYAYGGAPGEIRVRVARIAGDRIEVAVEDDGVGWTGKGEIKGSGLGSRIIRAMTQSLQTDLIYQPIAKGTRAVMTIAVDAG
ncbi:MAG TPA: histidine kinase dimerization/phosphoacceptor domain -containing protein [Rhizomicrobium sp.]